MNRPYITCYMMNSLDGKIIGEYFETERGQEYIAKYEQIHDEMNAKAFIISRKFTSIHFYSPRSAQ